MSSTYKLNCLHCGERVRVRNSVEQHPLLRYTYLQCMNPECAATFRGEFEITHQMSPSSAPNPDIQLPIADAAVRRAASEASL